MKYDLISSIGKQLNIPKMNNRDWAIQTVYSVAGQMGLASLWDHEEGLTSVSVQHFKERVTQSINAFVDLFPEIGNGIPKDRSELVQEIYRIYLHTGFFYHASNQVSPAVFVSAKAENITLHRGFSPDAKLFMSGLGFYSISNSASESTVASMFDLQTSTFEAYLEELLSDHDWTRIEWPDNTEFLRLEPPFYSGYWKDKPDKESRVSLARFGDYTKVYVFYRYENGSYFHKAVPVWRIQDCFYDSASGFDEHYRISNALLKHYGTLPEIRVKDTGEVVDIKLGYRLPPSEEFFYKLYSWPAKYDISLINSQVFNRKMTKLFFPVFRHELETIGYSFVEE